MKLTKEKKLLIKRIFLCILGSFILGISTGLFLVPYDIVSGGISGLGIIFNEIFHSLDKEMFITILTWTFFLLGWLLLGTKFALKTVISAIVYPFSVMLGTFLHENTFLTLGSLSEVSGSINIFIAALIGGVLVGTGVVLTFLGGGSTGGVDVIILALQKFFGFKTSHVSFIIDSAIILIGFIFSKNLSVTLIGIISAFVASIMINRLFDSESNMIVNIISKKNEEINSFVIEELERGSTIINGIGGYTKDEVNILQVTLDIREYYILMDIIAKVDPSAFVTVTKASSVRGEGFKALQELNKVGKKNETK